MCLGLGGLRTRSVPSTFQSTNHFGRVQRSIKEAMLEGTALA